YRSMPHPKRRRLLPFAHSLSYWVSAAPVKGNFTFFGESAPFFQLSPRKHRQAALPQSPSRFIFAGGTTPPRQGPGGARGRSFLRPVPPDQQLQRLHAHPDGGGGVLAHLLVQAGGLPLLVPHHVEAAAAADAQSGGHHEQG